MKIKQILSIVSLSVWLQFGTLHDLKKCMRCLLTLQLMAIMVLLIHSAQTFASQTQTKVQIIAPESQIVSPGERIELKCLIEGYTGDLSQVKYVWYSDDGTFEEPVQGASSNVTWIPSAESSGWVTITVFVWTDSMNIGSAQIKRYTLKRCSPVPNTERTLTKSESLPPIISTIIEPRNWNFNKPSFNLIATESKESYDSLKAQWTINGEIKPFQIQATFEDSALLKAQAQALQLFAEAKMQMFAQHTSAIVFLLREETTNQQADFPSENAILPIDNPKAWRFYLVDERGRRSNLQQIELIDQDSQSTISGERVEVRRWKFSFLYFSAESESDGGKLLTPQTKWLRLVITGHGVNEEFVWIFDQLEWFDYLIAQDSKNIALINSVAYLAKKREAFDYVIKCYNQIIALKPDSAEAYGQIGDLYRLQGNTELAVFAYKKALSIQLGNNYEAMEFLIGLDPESRLEIAELAYQHNYLWDAQQMLREYKGKQSSRAEALREKLEGVTVLGYTSIAFNDGKHIWTMNSDGTRRLKLTQGENPIWLPNDERLSFRREGGLYAINEDGTNERQILAETTTETILEVETLAETILASLEYMKKYLEWKVILECTKKYMEATWADYSLATDLIVYERGGSIYVADKEGKNTKQICSNGATPAWSPDGQWIVFAINDGSVPEGAIGIYIMKPDGSDVQYLGPGYRPSWSYGVLPINISGIKPEFTAREWKAIVELDRHYDEAQRLLKEGKWNEAIAEYQSILQQAPNKTATKARIIKDLVGQKQITISSEPQKAEVFVKGKALGVTPLTITDGGLMIDFMVGSETIEMKKIAYKDFRGLSKEMVKWSSNEIIFSGKLVETDDFRRAWEKRVSFRRNVSLGNFVIGAGAGVVAGILKEKADSAYESYLNTADPKLMEQYYNQATKRDKLSAALFGTAGIALGASLLFFEMSKGQIEDFYEDYLKQRGLSLNIRDANSVAICLDLSSYLYSKRN